MVRRKCFKKETLLLLLPPLNMKYSTMALPNLLPWGAKILEQYVKTGGAKM